MSTQRKRMNRPRKGPKTPRKMMKSQERGQRRQERRGKAKKRAKDAEKGDEGPQSPPWERAHTPDLLADLHKMWPVRPVGKLASKCYVSVKVVEW